MSEKQIGNYTYTKTKAWETRYPNITETLRPSHKAMLDRIAAQDERIAELEFRLDEKVRTQLEKREVIYWDCDERVKLLMYKDIDEAIEAYLDYLNNMEEVEVLPTTITVYGHAKVPVSITPGSTLDRELEYLDEEHGNPDGAYTRATEKMKAAEKVFHDAMLSEYVGWCCEVVEKREINVKEWRAANGG